MTNEYLLKASIAAFEDKQTPCQVHKYARKITKEGYTYLEIEEDSREIFCAIHIETDFVEANEQGVIITAKNIELSTREVLDNSALLRYGDLVFFIKSYSGWNQTMAQYMYMCNAITLEKLVFLDEPSDILGYSAYDKLIGFDASLLPLYFKSYKLNEKLVFLDITETEQQSLIQHRDGSFHQLSRDSIQLILLNYTREEVMQYVRRLCDYSTSMQTFGLVSLPQIKESRNSDRISQLRALEYTVTFDISYDLTIDAQEDSKIIRKAFYKILDIDYTEREEEVND